MAELLMKWAQADADDQGRDELPKQLRKTKNRLKALQKAKKALKEQAAARHQNSMKNFEAEEMVRQEDYESDLGEAMEQDEHAPGLRVRRLELGLSQKDLVAMTGLKPCRVSQLESGYRAPSEAEKRLLERALDVESLRYRAYSAPNRSHFPQQIDHEFHRKPIALSTANRSRIPP